MCVMKRTHPIRLLAGSVLLAGLATPSHARIFDQDDRQYARPAEGSLYSPVGLVRQGSTWSVWRAFTTGFLIDDCHVLTSQAVLGYGQAPFGKRLKFETAIGLPQHQSTGATVVAAGGIERHETPEERFHGRARSWLLLRLDRCIGVKVGHVTLKTGPFSPYEFRDLRSAGYPTHRSRERGLTVDPSCKVVASRGPIWLNDCAAVKADSGDPIFRISDAGPRPRMEVYAMQAYATPQSKPMTLTPGYENHAVPMSLILPQIERYLSLPAAAPIRSDALPRFGASASVPSDSGVLDTRLVIADARSHSESRAK